MVFLYALATTLLYPFLFLARFFSKKANVFWKKRQDSLEKVRKFHRNKDFSLYWLHASSVGELDQCKAIAKIIKEREPNSQIVQSVFSNSVTDKQLLHHLIDFAFHLPLDFFWAYEIFFRLLRPKTLIVTAWDSWLNLFLTAKRYGTRTFLVCASIHSNSGRLKYPGKFLTRKTFSYLDGLMPSSEILRPYFQTLIDETKIGPSADSRFDSVIERIESRKEKPFLPKAKDKVLIFASTYEVDESILFPLFNNFLSAGFSLWIFPHKLDSDNIDRIGQNLRKFNLKYELYSKLNPESKDNLSICLFDKIGILAHAYEYGFYTYVGGAFHHRVHNVIEPAYFGLPILTGLKIAHSSEALALHSLGGLFVVKDGFEFTETHLRITSNRSYYEDIKTRNRDYVLSRKGESQLIYEYVIGKE